MIEIQAVAERRAAGELGRALIADFKRHELLTYASAISFQILKALVPFLMFELALAGLLDLGEVWRNHLAPALGGHVSPAMFSVISSAVNKALSGRQAIWATFGGALALWQVSGAVRAVMAAFDRIYGAHADRPLVRRYLTSFALALATAVCFIGATACLVLEPLLLSRHDGLGALLFLARWLLATGLLALAIGLLVRFAPATEQPLPWVSLGSAAVTLCWLVTSLVFYLYLTLLASYGSLFGGLASVIVALLYLYISTMVFLFGAELDAVVRAHVTGSHSGSSLRAGSDG